MIVSKFYILYDTLFSRFWQVFLCRIMTFFHFSPIFHLLSAKKQKTNRAKHLKKGDPFPTQNVFRHTRLFFK